ncbi:mini-chromosome maintenance complex-binding protein [Cricetulus griseus]|uniref:Mini-chromosome maintenance complex-binding protein n=1 Tax=Cricetulus griseus TaxID=10029 RepID=A0A061I8U5_CRIGR|nr:mini-chromosome maintenance complex-binding protein [Cricetulus griseus]
MPCGEDWLSHPLGIVQGFFEVFIFNTDVLAQDLCRHQRMALDILLHHSPFYSLEVPSLNEVPLHYLKPNSFVKFRCMIQDMFDPEFYMGVYETVNQTTKARVLHFGKYRDVAECGPQQELDLSSPRSTTAERQTFYCVPVPGESSWVKEISFSEPYYLLSDA